MSYVAPAVDYAGLHLPTYQDILDDLIEEKKRIYGADIYLGTDSTDYQELAMFALKIYDTLQAVQLAYNNRGPSSAVGSGLDGVVKINGISRQASSYSTVDLLITGVVGTTILGGIVQDVSKQNWNLPASVTIPEGGLITVTATSALPGAVTALAGSITKILTLQAGWFTVTNPYAATAGVAVETDALLRARQQLSTAIAAVTPMDTLLGAVAAVTGVSRYKGYENDTISPDGNGVPAHSICIVVEGGDSEDIAEAIALKKTLGTGTYGTTEVTVYDYNDNPMVIKFYRVLEVVINVKVTIKALQGYSSSIGAMIKDAIMDYINEMPIGDDVLLTKVTAAASLWGTSEGATFSITSVELGKAGDSPATSANNVVIDFNESAVTFTDTSPDYIELVVT